MSTPPIPQTTVSQSGMLSRFPGAKNLPSRPMMMPAMITPMMSTATPFTDWERPCSSAVPEPRPAEGSIQHGDHRTTEVHGSCAGSAVPPVAMASGFYHHGALLHLAISAFDDLHWDT